MGHEYAHGLPFYSITDGSGNPLGLTYQGESGALDEAQAYLWGEMFEKERTGSNDWKVLRSSPIAAPKILVLSDPPSSTVRGTADRFNSPIFYCGPDDNGGVHYNAGVVTKAFYLISEGGTFNGVTVAGLGPDKMMRILYRAITSYYTPNTTFNAAYLAILEAATDLYPDAVPQVRRALQAVEMDQAGHCRGAAPRIPRSVDVEGW